MSRVLILLSCLFLFTNCVDIVIEKSPDTKLENEPITIEKINNFITENKIPGLHFKGNLKLMKQLRAARLGTAVYPTLLIINDNLELVYKRIGHHLDSKKDLIEAIDCNVVYCDPNSKYAKNKHKYTDKYVKDVELKNLDGDSVQLSSLINRNSVAVIDFWTIRCRPCKALFEDLKEIHEKYEKMGVRFISINCDQIGEG